MMQKIKGYTPEVKCKTIHWQTPDFNGKEIAFYKKTDAKAKKKERITWYY